MFFGMIRLLYVCDTQEIEKHIARKLSEISKIIYNTIKYPATMAVKYNIYAYK